MIKSNQNQNKNHFLLRINLEFGYMPNYVQILFIRSGVNRFKESAPTPTIRVDYAINI